MIGQLSLAVVVDDSIRYLRPPVAHVPPQDSTAAAFPDAEPLDKELQRFRLRDLRGENEIIEILGHVAEKDSNLVGHKLVDPVVVRRATWLRANRVGEPLFIVLPGPDVVGRHHPLKRRTRRTAVVADLADKMRV